MTDTELAFSRLRSLVELLRSPEGCPWDRQQTPESIKKYLDNEIQELFQALKNEDIDNIEEELGDLIFLLLFLCQLYSEQGKFSLKSMLERIEQKMIRRHPHVFAGAKIETVEELNRQWEQIKKEEKKERLSESKNGAGRDV